MTELRIDGVAVELPASFSISIKRENPFFTKSGEYTYDIELPLESSVNAGLYSFLHRINSVAEIKQKRRAVLIADNRVYLDGTEIITGWTNENVKIQLVSGNSEMNYLADEKTLISDLRMIETPVSHTAPSIDHIAKSFPDVDYCLPWVALADGAVINPWVCDKRRGPDYQWCAPVDAAEMSFIPQPYLCAFIRELVKALGYVLTYNALDYTFVANAFICHSQPTFKWSEMLPGLTARDFLESVERTFNVSFRIDFRTRTVQLLLNAQYFKDMPEAYVQNVSDDFDVDLEDDDDENTQAYNLNNIQLEYDLPDTPYYQQARLSDYARNHVVKRAIGSDFTNFFAEGKGDENHIWSLDGVTDLAREFGAIPNDTHNHHYWRYVDFFKDHIVGKPDLKVKMPMVPAELSVAKVMCYYKHLEGKADSYDREMPMAADTIADNKEKTLDDILAMKKAESGDAGRIRLALYRPMYVYRDDNTFGGGPQAFTDYTLYSGYAPYRPESNTNDPISLRPSEIWTVFYSGGYEIDIVHPMKIRSFDVNLYDASSVFVIRNKRFLCKDIEYVIGPNGRMGAWQGTFFPVKLSDTEAYKRWILADGRWRDGGVWLDDGRWLDDKPINHDKKTDTI